MHVASFFAAAIWMQRVTLEILHKKVRLDDDQQPCAQIGVHFDEPSLWSVSHVLWLPLKRL